MIGKKKEFQAIDSAIQDLKSDMEIMQNTLLAVVKKNEEYMSKLENTKNELLENILGQIDKVYIGIKELQNNEKQNLELWKRMTKEKENTINDFWNDMRSKYTENLALSKSQIAETEQIILRVIQVIRDEIDRNTINVRGIDNKIDNIYAICSEKQDYYITKTKKFNNNFLWYTNCDDDDNVTSYVRAGYSGRYPDWDGIDDKLWDLLPEKGVFLDIGANIGAFALPMASFGWTGYAIEASEKNAYVLQKSIEANNFNIKLIEKAIWEKSGTLKFVQKGPQGFVENIINTKENYEEVEAICMDDYKKESVLSTIKKIDFIKMDIEGSEVAAIKGMKNFLKDMNYPPIYIEINIWNLYCMETNHIELFGIISELGYKPYSLKNGVLYEYDINNFPDNPCVDYLLLRHIPDYLVNRIVGKIVQSKEEKLNIMRFNMENFKNWVLDNGMNPYKVNAHIAWYALIDSYPEYSEDPILYEYRKIIADKLRELRDPIFNYMIEHFGIYK